MPALAKRVMYVTHAMPALVNRAIYITSAMPALANRIIYVTSAMPALANAPGCPLFAFVGPGCHMAFKGLLESHFMRF